MVSPVALHGEGLDHASVTMLAKFCMRVGLQPDGVASAAVLKAIRLDIDGTGPVIPEGIFFAIDVDVRSAHLIGELVLLQLILVDAIILCFGLSQRSMDIQTSCLMFTIEVPTIMISAKKTKFEETTFIPICL